MSRFLSKDFLSGLMFIAFGLTALWFGRHLAPGTTVRMGPGYVPHMLAYILIVLGGIVSVFAAFEIGEGEEAAAELKKSWRTVVAIAGATVACLLLYAYVSYYAMLAGVAASFAGLSLAGLMPGPKLTTIGLSAIGCALGGVIFALYSQTVGMTLTLVFCSLAINWPADSKVKPIVMVTVGIVCFALLFESTGMLPALIVLILIASLGGDEFKLIEVAANVGVLAILSLVVFWIGLRMNIGLFYVGSTDVGAIVLEPVRQAVYDGFSLIGAAFKFISNLFSGGR